ncbi:MAG: glycosyltransferase family 4 protein [Chloroflexi bacterium]|nr:glycosyltransferase family 4 protein [Chloroflexota bacterium]
MESLFEGASIAVLGPFPPRPGGVSVQCGILAERLQAEGANLTRIDTAAAAVRRRGRSAKPLLPLAQMISITRQLRSRSRWEIVHVHAASWWGFMPAVLAARFRDRIERLVVTYHGGEAESFMAKWGWLARPTLRRYDALLTLTSTQARIFENHGLNPVIVPNIVPIERFPFRARGPLAPRILWLRQMEPRYRPADALDVLARVQERFPDATLALAGDGTLAGELRTQVERRGLQGVRFLGHLAAEAIPAAYAQADIFLNTSAVDNLPLTLIEAAASGLPIVSTNAGAIPDLIRDGENGLLAPVGDAEKLAAAILRLLHDPDLAQRLSHAARATAKTFDWPHIAPRLAAAYGLPDDKFTIHR